MACHDVCSQTGRLTAVCSVVVISMFVKHSLVSVKNV